MFLRNCSLVIFCKCLHTPHSHIAYNTDQRIWSRRYNFMVENVTIFFGFKLPPFQQCKKWNCSYKKRECTWWQYIMDYLLWSITNPPRTEGPTLFAHLYISPLVRRERRLTDKKGISVYALFFIRNNFMRASRLNRLENWKQIRKNPSLRIHNSCRSEF